MPAAAWHVCLTGKTGSEQRTIKVMRLTQAVWKRFSSPKNCKQPGAMDLDATV
jgi:hypothetical protein